MTKSAQEQFDHLTRGIDVVLPEGELLERLEEGRPLRVKLGVDPTAPDVTLGWAVVFRLLRRFQDLGHTAVLILGDFTARVGDPSGKSETRKRLDADEVDQYAESCLPTIKRLLSPERLEIRPNSEWLAHLQMADVLEMTSAVTVSRIMDRDDFKKRWEAQEPISLVEFMYPLLQAMDSVAVEADIEIGGTDQLFNLLVGRDLQERHGQRPQLVMTVPLLVGTDGEKKMSQSLANYISVNDPPEEMFGKTMNIPDGAMEDWLVLAADVEPDEAARIIEEVRAGRRHPGATKRALARKVVALYHGEDAAHAAEEAFDRLFVDKEVPEDVAEFQLPADDPVRVPALLKEAGLVSSNSEARRLVAQGAVKVNGERFEGEEAGRSSLIDAVVQVGKRRFVRLVEAR